MQLLYSVFSAQSLKRILVLGKKHNPQDNIMKYQLLFIFLTTFLSAALFTPIIRSISLKSGFLDKPNRRKVHRGRIPSLGGLAIFVSFLIGILLAARIWGGIAEDKLFGIIISSVILVAIGIYDDIRNMPAALKLAGQLAVALIAYSFGFRIEEFFGFEVTSLWLKILSFTITIGWIIGAINAINLLDGLDGLACGICAIISLFLFIASYTSQNYLLLFLSIALTASCLGFLPFNFYPASIFMGDTGSMFLGFMLSIIAIESYQKSTTFIAVLVPITAMAVPLIDTALSIIRRLVKRKPIFQADKNHIHHKLYLNEKSQPRVVLTLYSVTFFFGLIALGLKDIKGIYMAVALILIVLVTFRWIKNSGFLET
jgi:UDP-GlcNAc:undecaprenyl-phosphate GlcNAc-1-phosphate transferase